LIVELDVYSGRPNPRWELDERGADALRQLVAGLAPAAEAPPEPPGLGYRGLLFEGRRAYRTAVTDPEGALADPGASVERFLLERAPAELAALVRRSP
jgi:hypothetical protein